MYTLINDNFLWIKSSIKIILIHVLSQFDFIDDLAIFKPSAVNQETKVNVHNRTVFIYKYIYIFSKFLAQDNDFPAFWLVP